MKPLGLFAIDFLFKVLHASQLPYRLTRIAILGICYFTAIAFITTLLSRMDVEEDLVFARDSSQIYLMVEAAKRGESLYQPICQMAKKYSERTFSSILENRSPYPPTLPVIIWLSTDSKTIFEFNQIWLLTSIIALCLTVHLLISEKNSKNRLDKLILAGNISAILVFSSPVRMDLFYGQMNCHLLLLLVLVWKSLRIGHRFVAGALFGLSLSIKPIFILILLLSLLMRNWFFVFTALLTTALLSMASFLAIGGWSALYEFLEAGSSVSSLFANKFGNFSIPYLLIRIIHPGLFFVIPNEDETTKFGPINQLLSPSFFEMIISLVFSLSILWLCINAIQKETNADIQFFKVALLSVLFTPVAWVHYLIAGIPLVLLLVRRLITNNLSSKGLFIGAILLALFFINWIPYAFHYMSYFATASGVMVMPFSALFISQIPALLCLCIIFIKWDDGFA